MTFTRLRPSASVTPGPPSWTIPTAADAALGVDDDDAEPVHRQATMSSCFGWTSSSANVAGVSPPSVLMTATPEWASDPITRPRRRFPLAVTTSSCDAPATADAAVTTSSPPGRTTPVIGAGPLASTLSRPTSDGRTEATSRITSWPTTGIEVNEVVAAILFDPSGDAVLRDVVVACVSTSVSTTAMVVATAAAPTTPAATDARRA